MEIRIQGEEDEPREDLERKVARGLSAVARGHNLSDENAARVRRKVRPVITEVLAAPDGRERQSSAPRRKDVRPVKVSLKAFPCCLVRKSNVSRAGSTRSNCRRGFRDAPKEHHTVVSREAMSRKETVSTYAKQNLFRAAYEGGWVHE